MITGGRRWEKDEEREGEEVLESESERERENCVSQEFNKQRNLVTLVILSYSECPHTK